MTILVDARPLVDRLQGGVTRVTTGLIPALIRCMPEHRFVFATTGLKKPTIDLDTHDHLSLPNKLWSSLCVAHITSLDRAFQKHKPDLLFLPNIGFIGTPNIPYALLVHDLSFIIEPRWYSRKGRLWHKAVHALSLIRQATILFAVSERTKQDLIDILHIPAERITVIPLGLDAATSQSERPLVLDQSRYVVALGGNHPRKNTICVIQAIQDLRQNPQYKDVLLVLFGATKKQLYPPHVVALGRPNDEGRDAILRHANAFLYPSWYEGFGLPLLEAMAAGLPVLASDILSSREIDPGNPIYFDPRSIEDMSGAMLNLIENIDSPKVREAALRGRERAMKYTWRKTAEETLKIYKELLN